MSYRDLGIWSLAREVVVEIHNMTGRDLSTFEMYEEGRQITRSVKSVKSNIVEGYGRRRYKQEFLRFVSYALASNDETIDHLETLFETGSLSDESKSLRLHDQFTRRGKKPNQFKQSVKKHISARSK